MPQARTCGLRLIVPEGPHVKRGVVSAITAIVRPEVVSKKLCADEPNPGFVEEEPHTVTRLGRQRTPNLRGDHDAAFRADFCVKYGG